MDGEPGTPRDSALPAVSAGQWSADAAPRASHNACTLTDLAMRLFSERGYEGTTMRDLARAAHITVSSFYNHVSGKEELLDRGLTHLLDAFVAVLDEPGSVNGTAAQRFSNVLRRLVVVLIEHGPYVVVLVRVRGNTPVEQRLVARRAELIQRLERFIASADRERDRRTQGDLETRAKLLFGLLTSIAEWYEPRSGPMGDEALADGIVAFVLNAWVLARKAVPAGPGTGQGPPAAADPADPLAPSG